MEISKNPNVVLPQYEICEKCVPLPCPFCGIGAEVWAHYESLGGDTGRMVYHAGCRNLDCNVRPYTCCPGHNDGSWVIEGEKLKSDHKSEKDSVRLWNARR